MGFIKVSGKELEVALPAKFMDVPGDQETWTAVRLSGEQSRRIWEVMNAMVWETVSSYKLVQAWLSFGGSTFMLYDPETEESIPMFPSKSEANIIAFTAAWDMLPDEVKTWVIEDVVYEINPQWDNRPGRDKTKDDPEKN